LPLVDNNPIPKLAAVMKRDSTNENFESFLRQNAEDHRMHPSSKVWEGISDSLKKRKRKFYFGLLALLVSSSVLGYTLLELSFDKLAETSTPTLKNSSLNTSAPTKTNSSANVPAVANKHEALGDVQTQSKPAVSAEIISTVRKQELVANKINNALNATSLDQDAQISQENLKESWTADLLNSSSNFLNNTPTNFLTILNSSKNSLDFSTLDAVPSTESNTPQSKNKAGRFSMMFYFTPTVSYRRLSENKSYIRSAPNAGILTNSQLQDVNSAVKHKPNIGLELGLTSKYAITKNVKLRAGVQFNISRYNMQASKHTPELATFALNNGSAGVQSVGTMSTYRNTTGSQTEWLENFYFQVSAPIGAEVKLAGNDKVYFGAASTVQPTYVLGDKAYLLTTDYKNYAQVPWLMRRWNVNTNLETFVAYSSGKIKWQVGPQVRYQLLSSFANKYPVKENLFDFGFKVGISVNPNQ
jgi:hypothetical protein